MADQLMGALRAIDYPPDRLQILFLTEADDDATREALSRPLAPPDTAIVTVPASLPRTKPRALNVGLGLATGDIIGVLDAEDQPAPSQVREAALAFLNGPPDLAVVQAPLYAGNGDASWISGQFAFEYAVHFGLQLPFVARLGMPLALGGTSNYFRRDCLVAAGGWDAWNVTEDADLGLRLARMGYQADMIRAPTLEEAPVRLRHWLAQRTRWMKGHLQTWLVLMRHPGRLLRELGLWRFLALQVTLGGGLLAALLHGPMLVWMIAGLLLPGVGIESWQAMLFGAGYGSVLAAAMAAPRRSARALTYLTWPVYWPLLSLAMLLALIEMKLRPHHWAKTPHGVRARR